MPPMIYMAGRRSLRASFRAQSSGTSSRGVEQYADDSTYGVEDVELQGENLEQPTQGEGEGEEIRDTYCSGSTSTTTRRGRGPNKAKNLQPPPGQKWKVQYNNRGKPIGIEGKKLSRRIGLYVRDPIYCRLVLRWREMTQDRLDNIWEQILLEYDFQGHPRMKEYVFDVAQDRWKEWKHELKQIWKKFSNDPVLLEKKLGGRVVPEDWDRMIAHWKSDAGEKEAQRNAANRAVRTMMHRSGTVTFAQLGADMARIGEPAEDLDVYLRAYTPRDPFSDPDTAEKLRRIQELRETQASSHTDCSMEHILTEVIGDSKGKAVRGLGNHHKKRVISTSAGRYSQEQINNLVSQNQMLTEDAARRDEREQNILEELQRNREELQINKTNYARLYELVDGLYSRFPNSQTHQPSDEASGGSRPGGSRQ